jgi:hypothetical protein
VLSKEKIYLDFIKGSLSYYYEFSKTKEFSINSQGQILTASTIASCKGVENYLIPYKTKNNHGDMKNMTKNNYNALAIFSRM